MAVEVLATKAFEQAMYQHEFPIQKVVCSKIRLLAEYTHHPSLPVQPVHQVEERTIWECFVTYNERLLFERRQNKLVLWYLGTNAIADQANQFSFENSTGLGPLSFDLKTSVLSRGKSTATVLKEHADTNLDLETLSVPPQRLPNRFQFFEDAHLRILGVPTNLIQHLKDAPSLFSSEKYMCEGYSGNLN